MATRGRKQAGREAAADRRPAELVGVELDARRLGRSRTAALLKGERLPLRVIEAAQDVAALAEDTLQSLRQRRPPQELACKEGCAWCCHLEVGTAVPEVLRIAAYLRQTFSPEELQACRERLARLEERRRQMKAGRQAKVPLPCALLVEGRCLAYPVRPLTCRGFNSRDAARCEQFLKEPRNTTVPNDVVQLRLMTFALDGMRAGLAEAGLKGDLLELTAALRIALDVPDAAERWLAGEPVFAPAATL